MNYPTFNIVGPHPEETPKGGVVIIQTGTLHKLLDEATKLDKPPEDWGEWINHQITPLYCETPRG